MFVHLKLKQANLESKYIRRPYLMHGSLILSRIPNSELNFSYRTASHPVPSNPNPINSGPYITTSPQLRNFRRSKDQTFIFRPCYPLVPGIFLADGAVFFFPSLTDVDVIYSDMSNVPWNKGSSAIYPAKGPLVV